MAAAFPTEIFFAARPGDANLETLVFLFIDKLVVFAVAPHRMTVKPVLALSWVLNGIEKSLIVIGPGNRSGFLRGIRQVFAGAQVTDMQAILPEPSIVG